MVGLAKALISACLIFWGIALAYIPAVIPAVIILADLFPSGDSIPEKL